MKPLLILCFLGLATFSVFGGEWALVQETGASAQLQTVQATGYEGGTQTSGSLAWTLGLDWNRWLTLRGGLTARSVQTSPVYKNTVYPGYLGWGWTAAVDWFPLRTQTVGDSLAAGLTLAGSYEYLEYPGLYKSFVLPGLTFALAGEVVPADAKGLAFRLRMPVGLDQRSGFSLAWRAGAELSVVFRGVGGQTP